MRWERADFEPLTPEFFRSIRALAKQELGPLVKWVKNLIKNPIEAKEVAVLAAYQKIGLIEELGKESPVFVLEDGMGSRIALKDEERAKPTTGMLANLPDARLLENQALFGKMFYDSREHRICMQPFSIVTEQAIIRLAY